LRTPKQKNGKRSPSRCIHSWFQRVVVSSFQNPVDVYVVLAAQHHSVVLHQATAWKQQVWQQSLLKYMSSSHKQNLFFCLQHVTEGEMHAIVNRQAEEYSSVIPDLTCSCTYVRHTMGAADIDRRKSNLISPSQWEFCWTTDDPAGCMHG
jgi:aspartyl-tRNA synthetase